MAEFLDLEAEESTNSEEEESERIQNKGKTHFAKDSSEEEEYDEDEVREIMNDLIDDDSIAEESDEESDNGKKRNISDEEEDDDSLEDDDYDLLEENLGRKVKRNKPKRLKIMEDSEEEEEEDDGNGGEIDMEMCTEDENYEEEEFGDEETDNVINKQKPIFEDPTLQEAQEIFGVDFNFCGNQQEETDKRKPPNKSKLEPREPSKVESNFLTDRDKQICQADIPERIQLRSIPITTVPRESNELSEEAVWIYQQAFCKPTISTQAVKKNLLKGPEAIPKIRKTLDFLRNQHLEVPFIAFYRKEYVEPELNINDLWRIHKFDEGWCQLKRDKENLLSLIRSLRKEQDSQFRKTDYVGAIKDSDIEFLKSVQTFGEVLDVNSHIHFYHSQAIKNLKAEEMERRSNESKRPFWKYANSYDIYSVLKRAGLDDLASRFGLTPQKFAENLRDNHKRHEVEQDACSVKEIAEWYACSKFPTESDVLEAAESLVALQISKEPMLKRCVREVFFKRATITVRPTELGVSVIDEDHNCYSMKYLKNKPVTSLSGDQFLKLNLAQKAKLLTVTIDDTIRGNNSDSFVDEAKQLYVRDEFSKNVKDWNSLRGKCVERAFTKYIFPKLKQELENILLEEAEESILTFCRKKIYNCLKVAPYRAQFSDEDDNWETSKGLRVMAIAYALNNSAPSFICNVAPHGIITDYLKLPHLLKHKTGRRLVEQKQKDDGIITLRNFIYIQKPHLIVIGGESREALLILNDVKHVISDLVQSIEGFPSIEVEIVDNEFAKVYANSNQGKEAFPKFPELLRQAVSLARNMQDPLIEYAQLCNSKDEILSWQHHILQREISQDKLLENIHLEFVNRTNEVGVDINQAIKYPNTSKLLQFLCGFGPRKAEALLQVMEQTEKKFENRTQLVTLYHIGPSIFINSSGFIKIDAKIYVEPLDGSRIHPESYYWAKRMAVDASENEDDEDLNPKDAVVKIFNSPEQLDELDLDFFAIELERAGYGRRNLTLHDIREEFYSPYKDLRCPYVSPNSVQLFGMLTKLTSNTLYCGKKITGQVSEILFVKPKPHQLKTFVPKRNAWNNCWRCSYCKDDTFEAYEDVWHHFNAGNCRGKATIVKLQLDYGICGFIHISNVMDSFVKNLQSVVVIGEVLNCRVLTIDTEKFSVNCTSKPSDLVDKNNKFKPKKDQYYDGKQEEKDKYKKEVNNNEKQKFTYARACKHPCFKNISFGEAEQYLAGVPPGEVIVRPSGRRPNYLICTWKVAENIYQYIEVKEEDKINDYTIGTTLRVDDQKFEELEEIIAMHINPMVEFSHDLLCFKYYKDANGGNIDKMEEILNEEKRKNSSKFHYFVSASKSYPGKFVLSYLLGDKHKHEYITLTPRGYQFRRQLFCAVKDLFHWFKLHINASSPVEVISSSLHRTSFQKATEGLSGTRRISEITNQTHSYSSTPSSSRKTSSALNYRHSSATLHNHRSRSKNQTYPEQLSRSFRHQKQPVVVLDIPETSTY